MSWSAAIERAARIRPDPPRAPIGSLMPRFRSRQFLAATAVAATAGLLLPACHGSEPDRAPPKEPAPVRAPTDRDHVLGAQMEPTAFRAPVRHPNLLMITADDASLKDMRY